MGALSAAQENLETQASTKFTFTAYKNYFEGFHPFSYVSMVIGHTIPIKLKIILVHL
jgi:hypothetical protein